MSRTLEYERHDRRPGEVAFRRQTVALGLCSCIVGGLTGAVGLLCPLRYLNAKAAALYLIAMMVGWGVSMVCAAAVAQRSTRWWIAGLACATAAVTLVVLRNTAWAKVYVPIPP